MKVVRVLVEIIVILALLAGSVLTVVLGFSDDSSADTVAIDAAFQMHPDDVVALGVDAAIATRLADVFSGKAYVLDETTLDFPEDDFWGANWGTYAAPTQSGTIPTEETYESVTLEGSKDMAYAIYRLACLADVQVNQKAWLSTGWGFASLGEDASMKGYMDTYSAGVSIGYTEDAEVTDSKNYFMGGGYGWSETYTIVTKCTSESLGPALKAALNTGKKKQTGANGVVLEWKVSKNPQITATGGDGIFETKQIKVSTAAEESAEYSESDRKYVYPDLAASGEWKDAYGLTSPEKGGHVINPSTMQPLVITADTYNNIDAEGNAIAETATNYITEEMKAYLHENADGTYTWDYVIPLEDAEGNTYYRINFSLDVSNSATTEYSAKGLAKSVEGVGVINYTTYSTTFEVWGNGLFKMYSSHENWHLQSAGALASLNIQADSDANSCEFYTYDSAYINKSLKEHYITNDTYTGALKADWSEAIKARFPADEAAE